MNATAWAQEQLARIAELEAEVQYLSALPDDVKELEAENARLRALLGTAGEALEPFDAIGQWLFARTEVPDDLPVFVAEGVNGHRIALTRGDFKASHTALAAIRESEPPACTCLPLPEPPNDDCPLHGEKGDDDG